MKTKTAKIKVIASTCISILVLLITLLFIFIVTVQAAFPSKAMQINGFRVFTISYTKSMEPTLKYGDLIVVRDYDHTKIKVGDIISFKAEVTTNEKKEIVTHRVEKIVNFEERIYFITMGDNINIADSIPVTVDGYDDTNIYIGKMVFKSTFLGELTSFLRSGIGLFLLCFLTLSMIGIHVLGILVKRYEKKSQAENDKGDSDETIIEEEISFEVANEEGNTIEEGILYECNEDSNEYVPVEKSEVLNKEAELPNDEEKTLNDEEKAPNDEIETPNRETETLFEDDETTT